MECCAGWPEWHLGLRAGAASATELPAAHTTRTAVAAAPPVFGAAARRGLGNQSAAAPLPQVDRGPLWWPLLVAVLLLAALAVVVAPAGAVALPP